MLGILVCDDVNDAEARIDMVNYIAGFQECQRLHSVLGNLTPSIHERTSREISFLDSPVSCMEPGPLTMAVLHGALARHDKG